MGLSAVVPILGGIPIYFPSGVQANQSYEDIGGYTVHRMMNGAGVKQTHWLKIRTTISGEGMLPSGINALDVGQPLLLKSFKAMAVPSVSNVINIPPNRRSDVPITAVAILDTDYPKKSPVNVVGDVATVDVVAGAKLYLVLYYPEITVFANPVQVDGDRNESTWSWSIDCEEV